MSKILAVFMHPAEDSFNGAIYNTLTDELEKSDLHVMVTRLNEDTDSNHLTIEEYNKSLEGIYPGKVKDEHKKIEAADHIIFVFPVWWGGFPSIGKAYVDRNFSYGFAYELEGEEPVPLLKGKEISLIFTTGAPEKEFRDSGMYYEMIRLMDKSIFKFCGLKLNKVLHFGDVIQSSDDRRREMLESVEAFAAGLL